MILTNYDHTEVDIFYTYNIITLFYLLLTHSRHHTNKTITLQCSHVDHTTAQTQGIYSILSISVTTTAATSVTITNTLPTTNQR